MIRLLVAEDEPTAMRYITSLVDTHFHGVEIIAQAEDGIEARNAMDNLPVDILITDIQMPRMNGIELARWVCENKPSISTLIVSGYGDFEYTRGAIQAEVAEYLLKPFTPVAFVEALEKLCCQVVKKRRMVRERWLRYAVAGAVCDGEFHGLHSQEQIHLGVLLLGAASNRNRGDFEYPPNAPDELAAAYIHDESEICFALATVGAASWDEIADSLSGGASFYTAFVKTTALDEARSILPGMLQAAKSMEIPGKSQIIEYSGVIPADPRQSLEELSLIKQLELSVANRHLEKIKSKLIELFAYWESNECRLISAEMTLIRIVQSMAFNAPPEHGITQRDIAKNVPLICRESADYADMLGKTWSFCGDLYISLERQSESGQLINNIEIYIRERLGQPLSAQSICLVFGISVSNLHRLFRKYVKMSLVEYITELRIKEAKRMIAAHLDMSIKDIAEYLGFSDQFYFSKVFRSLTGISPSEYKSQLDIGQHK